jgi:hypothetical protein
MEVSGCPACMRLWIQSQHGKQIYNGSNKSLGLLKNEKKISHEKVKMKYGFFLKTEKQKKIIVLKVND